MNAKPQSRDAVVSRYVNPEVLLADLGIESPDDIHIEAIAQFCGATIVYEPLEGAEARLIGARDRAFITVNSRVARPRQRFSAAHELGHWIWDRGKMAFNCTDSQFEGEWSDEKSGPERRANRYAVALLLPTKLFLKHAATRECSFGNIFDLAGKFQTSFTATAIRMVELSEKPEVLVALDQEGVLWQTRSRSVPKSLKLRIPVHKSTIALELLQGQREFGATTCVATQTWFSLFPPGISMIREESRRIGRGKVLSILSWEN